MGIVQEIVEACSDVFDMVLTDYRKAPYQFILASNNEANLASTYTFTPINATFAEGRAIGSTTMNHLFRLELVDSFLNRDCDDALAQALYNQYDLVQDTLKELQKSKLALPTAGNQVLLISGLALDEPEIIEENGIVILRATFNIQYRYRNN